MSAWTKEDRRLRTPMALLPYQQRWLQDKSRVKVYEKSRRIGISWAEAADDSLLASSEKGMDVWYIGYNKDMAQEFIEDCADWSRHYDHAASAIEEDEFIFRDGDEDKAILGFRIRYDSGFKIVALSSRPSNLRGKQGKVVIDEAAFHQDLRELLKAAMALLMWGGKVAIISTHDGEDNAFNELLSEVKAGKKPYSPHRTTLDDALAEGLYERICLRLGREYSMEAQAAWRAELVDAYGDDADEELFCVPSRGSGIYFPGALVRACMDPGIPVIRWERPEEFTYRPEDERRAETTQFCEDVIRPLLEGLPENRPCYFGEDFARTGDLTVIIPGQEHAGMTVRAIFSLELRGIPFEQQKDILFFILERLPRFRGGAMDSRGNGQYLAEVAAQRYGQGRILQVMISQQFYRDAMPRYHAALEDQTIVLPLDGDTIDDHRLVRMHKGVAQIPEGRHTKGRDGKQRHGDTAIAACLLQYAVDNAQGGEIEYRSVARRRFGAGKGVW